MATGNPSQIISGTAGTNVTAARFAFRNAALTDTWDRATAATDPVRGVFRYTAAAGNECSVQTSGVVVVEAGAAVLANVRVMSDAAGRAITFAAGGGNLAIGQVVNNTTAGAAGDFLSIELFEVPIAIA
jgi:hypothetical protein